MSIVESAERPFGEEVSILSATECDNTYECRVALIPEDDGQFSIIATNLPGCASQGDTIEEAIENFKEAFQLVAEVYLEDEDFGEIPWEGKTDIPEGTTQQRWILVDVKSSVS